MKRIIFLIAIIVSVSLTSAGTSFAANPNQAHKYTAEEEQLLEKEYDELFEKWIAAGLSKDEIEDKTFDWLGQKNVSMNDPLIDYTDKHEMNYYGK
ncbi:MAG: hypothetical protein SPL69_03560 [Succinivibrionaceae bacterium]|nr:hypothetical protein [Succinivibrionaceae bacterium]